MQKRFLFSPIIWLFFLCATPQNSHSMALCTITGDMIVAACIGSEYVRTKLKEGIIQGAHNARSLHNFLTWQPLSQTIRQNAVFVCKQIYEDARAVKPYIRTIAPIGALLSGGTRLLMPGVDAFALIPVGIVFAAVSYWLKLHVEIGRMNQATRGRYQGLEQVVDFIKNDRY